MSWGFKDVKAKEAVGSVLEQGQICFEALPGRSPSLRFGVPEQVLETISRRVNNLVKGLASVV